MSQINVRTMQEETPSRRVVLRGALALGCGLLMPAALFGCGKKEADSAGAAPDSSAPPSADSAVQAPGPEAAAPEGSPAAGTESAAPAAKVSQASVQYRTQPNGEQKCSTCVHFIAESNTCKLVEGQISPEGWCVLWARKA